MNLSTYNGGFQVSLGACNISPKSSLSLPQNPLPVAHKRKDIPQK